MYETNLCYFFLCKNFISALLHLCFYGLDGEFSVFLWSVNMISSSHKVQPYTPPFLCFRVNLALAYTELTEELSRLQALTTKQTEILRKASQDDTSPGTKYSSRLISILGLISAGAGWDNARADDAHCDSFKWLMAYRAAYFHHHCAHNEHP